MFDKREFVFLCCEIMFLIEYYGVLLLFRGFLGVFWVGDLVLERFGIRRFS